MKHFLFLSLSSLFVLTISAQPQHEQDFDIDMNQPAVSFLKAPARAEAVPLRASFNVPDGTFFGGFSFNGVADPTDALYVPPFCDLTFVNTSTGASSWTWTPCAEGNIVSVVNKDKDLTLNYRYFSKRQCTAPVLQAYNDNGESATTSNATNSAGYAYVGGAPTYGWGNTHPESGSRYYSSTRYATNSDECNKFWANTAKLSDVSVRGFGELYYKPARPYALRGFSIIVRKITDVTSPVTLTIYKVKHSADGTIITSFDETLCSQTLTPDQFQSGGTNRYFLEFKNLIDEKTKQPVEGYTIDCPILVVVKLDDNDLTSQMGAFYNKISVDIPCHNFMCLKGAGTDGITQDYVYTGRLYYTDGCYSRSFTFTNLYGSFEYIIDSREKSDTIVSNNVHGGNHNISLYASQV